MASTRPPYRQSLAGTLLAAREAVMKPIRPILRESGLTEQQWRVLRVLVDEGETDPSGLSQAGLLYSPTVTRILKELKDRGLLTRRADVNDGRRWLISVTDEGRQLLESTAAKTGPLLEEYARRFTPERLKLLRAELAELAVCIGPLADEANGGGDD